MHDRERKEALRVSPRKSLSQHFLVNPQVALRIVEAAEISSSDPVLEIGPGRGALTGFLLERSRKVVAVEVDPRLCSLLRERFGGDPKFTLVEGDVLKVNLGELMSEGRWTVVANLPYHITSPVLFLLSEHREKVRRAVVMVQREVGRRMTASPGSRDYGLLSVMLRLDARPEYLFEVRPGNFFPRPKVKSAVVRLDFTEPYPLQPKDREIFKRLVRAAFGGRRKMLRNSLSSLAPPEVLSEASRRAGVDLSLRAEQVPLEGFVMLADSLRS
ncbi:MAG: ribosomal RNA small subunit methyltransferase A [Candidatus Latescibacterota bacterium]|nr:MAG: ribosomal RNA small subunit methyltransferase A [Candidatus Latescibacterota bacterium]RKY67004.1 MAG: ribosomal RNA small subunit methyltransferase A [Candidatus Latescibacterota bacterium]RKY70170.1 MAG: ribosomal RNA small subunit methyltransferase A [Candidatus Latescibacterota bacterium]